MSSRPSNTPSSQRVSAHFDQSPRPSTRVETASFQLPPPSTTYSPLSPTRGLELRNPKAHVKFRPPPPPALEQVHGEVSLNDMFAYFGAESQESLCTRIEHMVSKSFNKHTSGPFGFRAVDESSKANSDVPDVNDPRLSHIQHYIDYAVLNSLRKNGYANPSCTPSAAQTDESDNQAERTRDSEPSSSELSSAEETTDEPEGRDLEPANILDHFPREHRASVPADVTSSNTLLSPTTEEHEASPPDNRRMSMGGTIAAKFTLATAPPTPNHLVLPNTTHVRPLGPASSAPDVMRPRSSQDTIHPSTARQIPLNEPWQQLPPLPSSSSKEKSKGKGKAKPTKKKKKSIQLGAAITNFLGRLSASESEGGDDEEMQEHKQKQKQKEDSEDDSEDEDDKSEEAQVSAGIQLRAADLIQNKVISFQHRFSEELTKARLSFLLGRFDAPREPTRNLRVTLNPSPTLKITNSWSHVDGKHSKCNVYFCFGFCVSNHEYCAGKVFSCIKWTETETSVPWTSFPLLAEHAAIVLQENGKIVKANNKYLPQPSEVFFDDAFISSFDPYGGHPAIEYNSLRVHPPDGQCLVAFPIGVCTHRSCTQEVETFDQKRGRLLKPLRVFASIFYVHSAHGASVNGVPKVFRKLRKHGYFGYESKIVG